jgi:CRP-like cAMP-binding protein
MRAVAGIRSLRGLKNLSWLTPRQLNRLADALKMSQVKKHGIIFDKKHSPEAAYLLLSGVARITCRNRKGDRTLVIVVAPGMIPGVPPAVTGIRYDFRCEAVTDCHIGTISSYSGRWDLVQLRCSNFMGCSLEERVALILLELSETFGVRDGSGMRLTVPATHKDIAELVGASRPRVTEYLASFERKQLIVREGRELIVRCDRLERSLAHKYSSAHRRELGSSLAP